MSNLADVRRIAREVIEARAAGKRTHKIGRITFDLTKGGYCLRFVRQCHEAAAGGSEFSWPHRAQYAIQTMHRLMAGLEVPYKDRESADIVTFDKGKPVTATPGHIGIYLGKDLVAENTSSGKRGTPRAAGTKISTLASIGPARAQFFRTVPMAAGSLPLPEDALTEVLVIDHATGAVVARFKMVKGGDHVADQGKVYVRV